MKKFTTGRITKKVVEKKKPLFEDEEPEEVSTRGRETREDVQQEQRLIKSIQDLTDMTLTTDQIKKLISNLNIDMSRELTDDDLLLIYNVCSEPLIKKENNKLIFDNQSGGSTNLYINQLEKDSVLFKNVLPGNRIQAMYEFLPSLENNRINFRIDKDIFRNKPLLGKGLYKCNRCGSDDTEDREKQTRSADEPMTVFVSCRNCGHKWKFN
jgi:transcription elongation factor S-II